MKNKINILGTEYEILVQGEKENDKMKKANGICEQYSKKIILNDMGYAKDEPLVVENLQSFREKTLRHEIIHAFLGESGLRGASDWAEDEEMVDWFAIQLPKIFKAFEELGIEE